MEAGSLLCNVKECRFHSNHDDCSAYPRIILKVEMCNHDPNYVTPGFHMVFECDAYEPRRD